tara:strand:+ start:520 stop:819 length:300 start_codon:yes stop_codon:yes gene_type:complete
MLHSERNTIQGEIYFFDVKKSEGVKTNIFDTDCVRPNQNKKRNTIYSRSKPLPLIPALTRIAKPITIIRGFTASQIMLQLKKRFFLLKNLPFVDNINEV